MATNPTKVTFLENDQQLRDLVADFENAVVDAENFASATGSFTDDNGNTYQKGAKGWAADAEGYKNTAQTEASNAADEASDAQKHAQATTNFTDHDGNSFEQGAKGYRDEVSNVLDTSVNDFGKFWGVRDNTGRQIFRHLTNGYIEVYNFKKDRIQSLAKNDLSEDFTAWGVKSENDDKLIEHLADGRINVYPISGRSEHSIRRGVEKENSQQYQLNKHIQYTEGEARRLLHGTFDTSQGPIRDSFPRSTVNKYGKIVTAWSSDRETHGDDPGSLKVAVHDSKGRIQTLTVYNPNADYYYEAGDFLHVGYNELRIVVMRGDRSGSTPVRKPGVVLTSDDNGHTWTEKTTLPPINNATVPTSYKYDNVSGNEYIIMFGNHYNGILESTDRGSTWNLISEFSPAPLDESDFVILSHDASDYPEKVVVLSRVTGGINQAYSDDGMNSWNYAGKLGWPTKTGIRPKIYDEGGSLHLFYGIRNEPDDKNWFEVQKHSFAALKNDPSDINWRSRSLVTQPGGRGVGAYGEIIKTGAGPRITYFDDFPSHPEDSPISSESIGHSIFIDKPYSI